MLTAIPDPDGGMLRRLAAQAAVNGLSEMRSLAAHAGSDDAFGQEVQALVDGWRAVLGPDFPSGGPFDITGLGTQYNRMAAPDFPVPGDTRDVSADFIDGVSASSPANWLLHILIKATRLPETPMPLG